MGNKYARVLFVCILLGGCSTPDEPVITPPQPAFIQRTTPPSPYDAGIFADVDGSIVIQWKTDSTNNTTGYNLYRAINDSSVDADGLLASRTLLQTFESTSLSQPLDTSFRDTSNITPGVTYWYQLQAYYRSPTGKVTNSKPTKVDLSTSFHYLDRVQLLSPNGIDTLHGLPLKLLWEVENPSPSGKYELIVQRLDNLQYVCATIFQDYQNTVTEEYPASETPLEPGVFYRWRVKRIFPYGGSSSSWMSFEVF